MSVCIREPLTADRTYYVRTDGSDSNTGLTNDAAGAFLTIQKAVDTIADTLDIRGVDVTIQVADGAYNAPVVLRPYVGRTLSAYGPTLRGNPSTPANVTIDLSAGFCISSFACPIWAIDGFSLSTTGSGVYCVSANASLLAVRSVVYRASVVAHVRSIYGGHILLLSSYSITGGSQRHWVTDTGGRIFVNSSVTVTLSGTPAFSVAFAHANATGIMHPAGATFSGSATGTRYLVSLNAVILTNGAGPTYFPGNAAGVVETGGQYS